MHSKRTWLVLGLTIAMGQPTVIQINDVDIDARGLAYASDRIGTGLFVLEYRRPDK
jgi:hypothetical protein